MSSSSSGNDSAKVNPFSVEIQVETDLRPYVGIFAVLLFWYLQKVSVHITNNSDSVHSDVTIHLYGRPEMHDCEAIDETFIIPRLGSHDTDTRTFQYKRKVDCRYSFFPEIVSYR